MRNVIHFLIFSIPFFGYADTLDYWSVHLNDQLIGNYNSNSKDNKLVLNKDSISESDTLVLVYGNDHPCLYCEYYYAMKDILGGIKLHVQREKTILKKIKFPMRKILEQNQSHFKSQKFVIMLFQDLYYKDPDPYMELFYVYLE